MESDERFRLVLFFLGLLVLLYRFLNGAWSFVDHGVSWLGSHFSNRGRSSLDDFSNNRCHFDSGRSSSGSQFGFLLQTLFFTLATTHFTRVVRCAATWCQGAGRGSFNHWCSHFGDNRGFNNRSHFWFGSHNNRLDNRNFSNWRWRFDRYRLGNPVESGLLFANFTNGFGHGFSDGFNNRLCNHGRRFSNDGRLGSSFDFRLCFTNRSHFDFRSGSYFYRRGRFNDWRFDWSSFQCGGIGAFGLLVGLCFSRSADHGAGNGCGNS